MANAKPRQMYQDVGQALREFDRDVWVKQLFRRMAEQVGPEDNVVVSDLRQLNEYEALLEAGFTIARVKANEEVRLKRMKEKGDCFDLADLAHSFSESSRR